MRGFSLSHALKPDDTILLSVGEQVVTPRQKPHSGFRWPVFAAMQIAAPSLDVWNIISSPGNLEWCHPYCASNPVQKWPGPDSRDEVHYLNGMIYERQFSNWIEGEGYDLEIGRHGGPTSFVCWRITPQSENCCTLGITVHPHALRKIPVAIRWAPHFSWLRPLLKKYLDAVVRGIEWHVVHREPVPKNAFGKHPWFS